MPSSLIDFLAEVPLLADLPAGTRERIAAAAALRRLDAGEVLIAEGARGRDLSIVHSGRLEIVRAVDGARVVLGTVGRGATIGELSLLTHEPRAATVRALRESHVLTLSAAAFESILLEEPTACLALARILAARLVRGRPPPPLAATPEVIAVVALADTVPTDAVVEVLERDLTRAGTVETLRRPPPGSTIGAAEPPPVAPAAWHEALDRLEQSSRYVLLAPGAEAPSDPAWRTFCTRVADRVLLLSRGGTPPPWAIEDPGCRHRDVVFTTAHPTLARIAPAVDALDARAYHLLSPGDGFATGARRMARRVSGRAIGVVFSGGGARGHAHVGVIAALEEAGVQIDRVGGTSAGAIAAALVAHGRPMAEMEPVIRHELARQNPFGDLAVPRQAFSKGRRIRAALDALFGEEDLETATRPLYVVSCDLDAGHAVVHRRGRTADAVAASLSIPGLAPPARLLGSRLVDGGLLNNLPVDVMLEQAEGPIIAVDVMRHLPTQEDGIGPRDQRSSIVSTLTRAMMLGSHTRSLRNRDLADVVISPEVSDIGLLDFDRYDDAVAAGRTATLEVLGAIEGLGVRTASG